MSDVLEELAEEAEGKIDRHHVERRVIDWQRRVLAIYNRITGWLPSDFTTSRNRLLPRREEMMVRYGVPELELPVLEMNKPDGWFGKLVPRGLWIIGANSRLDLFVPEGHFLIIDRADNFEPPQWMIAPSAERRSEQELTRTRFLQALGL